MNPILARIVIETTLKPKRDSADRGKKYSAYELAIGLREMKINLVRLVKDSVLIILGIFSVAFGFKGFLLTNHFIDGGTTGISLLIFVVTSTPLYVLLILVNIPFVMLGYKIIGKSFAIKTALGICGLALVVATVSFPDVTKDNLLVAVFGGFFLGAGIGLSVRGGAVLDGTEVLAIFLSRKFGVTIGDVVIVINIVIFSAAAYFLSVEIALYSMITYLAALKTHDFVVEGIEEYTAVTIISAHHYEIRQMIIDTIGRGVTIYEGYRGFGQRAELKNVEILYTVVTRLELSRLSTEIAKIDPNAFVVTSSIKDIRGGMIKKRPLKR